VNPFDLGDLDEVRQQLRGLANAGTDADGQPLRGQGEAMEGMVKVTAEGGRLKLVDLNPRVMRASSQELAEAFTEAANAALNDLASKYPSVSAPPSVDVAALEGQLADVQDQARRRLAQFTQSVDEAMARIERS
jgi:DNA-binding protein YbaB